MSAQWHLGRKGKQYGPYTLEQLRLMAREGKVQKGDLIWSPELKDWTKAAGVPGIFESKKSGKRSPSPEPGRKNLEPVPEQSGAGKPAGARPKPRRRLYKVFGLGAAALLLIFVLLMLFLPGDREKTLGVFSVSAQGGQFAHEEVEITAAGGDGTFTVSRVTRRERQPEEVAFQSERYRLEGNLDQLHGEIRITLPLPEEALQAPYQDAGDLAGSLYIVMEEEVFTPSHGPQVVQRLLETTIDLEAGAISAVVQLDAPLTAMNSLTLLASNQLFLAQEEPLRRATTLVEFRIRRWRVAWRYADSPLGNFRAVFRPEIPQDNLRDFLSVMEKQKIKLEELGFSFAGRTSYPIEIHLENIAAYGTYQGSKMSAQGGRLELQRRLFEEQGHRDELTATAGHELLHLVQAFYDPRGSFDKNHPWIEQPYLWLDEAVATWYEPHALEQPGYLPANASSNFEFVSTPLFFPGSTTTAAGRAAVQDHGYGASIFIRYLTRSLGDPRLPSRIYSEVAGQASSRMFAGNAVIYALWQYDTTMMTQWINFLEAYFTAPETIAPGLDTSSLFQTLMLQADQGDNNYHLYFKTGSALRGHVSAESRGSLQKNEPASLTLAFTQVNLTASAVRIRIADSAIDRQAFGESGRLVVTAGSSGESGVLVYALQRDSGALSAEAGAPYDFLASDVHRSQTVIENFGYGAGSYQEVLLIPFNYDTGSRLQESSLTIEIVYEPVAGDYSVRIQEPRTAAYELSDGSTGVSHYFHAIPTPEGTYRFDWSFGDGGAHSGTGESSSGHYTYTAAGSYRPTVKIYDLDGNFLAEDSINITITQTESEDKEEKKGTTGPDIDWDCGWEIDYSELTLFDEGKFKYYFYGDPVRPTYHGLSLAWYDPQRNHPADQMCFVHGRMHGLWIKWFPPELGGHMWHQRSMDQGIYHGLHIEWHQNGNIRMEGDYNNGLQHGLWTIYYEDGSKEREGYYTNGARTGIWRFWEDGRSWERDYGG